VNRRVLLTVCFCLTLVAAVPYDGIGAAAYMRKYADFDKVGHDGCPAYFEHLPGVPAGNCCNFVSRAITKKDTTNGLYQGHFPIFQQPRGACPASAR
jgi:hypothetical protein